MRAMLETAAARKTRAIARRRQPARAVERAARSHLIGVLVAKSLVRATTARIGKSCVAHRRILHRAEHWTGHRRDDLSSTAFAARRDGTRTATCNGAATPTAASPF
jgi:hypothetical protein